MRCELPLRDVASNQVATLALTIFLEVASNRLLATFKIF
jgi:hypothetical protein